MPPFAATPPPLLVRCLSRLQWPLFSFARGIIGDEERARDLVQDVFVNAWRLAQRGVPPFTPGAEADEQGLRRWLFHDAYWRAVSAVRRDRRIVWQSLEQDAEPQAEYADDAGPFEDRVVEAEALRAALAELAPQDAACVLLSVVEGLSAAEVAQVTGISTEAAKKRISRAKLRLRAVYFAQNPLSQECKRP
jgi:RNA polymerase sigma-70 factor, ECF subfamily